MSANVSYQIAHGLDLTTPAKAVDLAAMGICLHVVPGCLNFEECVLRQLVPGLSYPALIELLLLASDLRHLAALLQTEGGEKYRKQLRCEKMVGSCQT